mmetsp:Transcript_7424/g.32748  ORF Transcript_7424/g.32748 Transcript_7424/m.32748 type:complete len:220 (-) Transcript_7424:384-1043(-)
MGSTLKSLPGGSPHASSLFLDFLSFPFADALPDSTPLFHRLPPLSAPSLSSLLSVLSLRSRFRFLSFFLLSFFSFLDFFSFLALFASLPGAPSLLLPGMGKPCAAVLALAIATSLRALSSLMIASSSSALATALNAAPSHASDLLGEVPFSFSRNPSCPHLSSVDPASILAVSFPWSVSILSDGRGPPHLRQLSLNLKFSAPQPHFQSFFLAASSSLSR